MVFNIPPLITPGFVVDAAYMNSYLRDNLNHLRTNNINAVLNPNIVETKFTSTRVRIDGRANVAWLVAVEAKSGVFARVAGTGWVAEFLFTANASTQSGYAYYHPARVHGPAEPIAAVTLGPLISGGESVYWVGIMVPSGYQGVFEGEVFIGGVIYNFVDGSFLPQQLTPTTLETLRQTTGVTTVGDRVTGGTGIGVLRVKIPPSRYYDLYRVTFIASTAFTHSFGVGFEFPIQSWDWQVVTANSTVVTASRTTTGYPLTFSSAITLWTGIIQRTGGADYALLRVSAAAAGATNVTAHILAGYRPYQREGQQEIVFAPSTATSGALITGNVEVIA